MVDTKTPDDKKLSVPSKTLSLKPRVETARGVAARLGCDAADHDSPGGVVAEHDRARARTADGSVDDRDLRLGVERRRRRRGGGPASDQRGGEHDQQARPPRRTRGHSRAITPSVGTNTSSS